MSDEQKPDQEPEDDGFMPWPHVWPEDDEENE